MRKVLRKYALKPHRYEKNGKVTFIDTERGRFAIKQKNNNQKIYEYLDSRSFNYYPKIISTSEDDFEITEFIEPIEMPEEQKVLDMIDLISLLHNKTTHYKEVDEADYKKIYEDVSNNIEYLYSYYNDIMTIIETKIYMSPSEYLLARNISKVYASLSFCKNELQEWYNIVKEKRKQRLVVLHNNLNLDHFIRNKNVYLTSWDKAKIDLPIFDIYKLYKRIALDFDFSEIFRRYESNYHLLPEERKLFFILIALPEKIEFNDKEYEMCKKISKQLDILYKTDLFLSPYYSKEKEHKHHPKE